MLADMDTTPDPTTHHSPRPTPPSGGGRTRSRLLGAAVLTVALAGCGRSGPEATSFGDAASLAPTTTVTTAPPVTEPPVTTEPPPPTTTVVAGVPVTTRAVTRLTPTTEATTVVTNPPRPAPAPQPEPTVPVPAAAVEPAPGPTVVVSSHGGPVRDHVSLVDNLRGRGLTVIPESSISQPFLHGDGTVLAVSGAGIAATRIQSFEYGSADAAAADAATFSPDGNPRGFMVDWIAPPHLFRTGRVLVIYNGTDRNLISLLTDLLGPQFAGR